MASVSAVRAIFESRPFLDNNEEDPLEKLIKTASDLYTVKKRFTYQFEFKELVIAKCKGVQFKKPNLNALYLDHA